MEIYLLSGLGADHRVFGRLRFQGAEVKTLSWKQPRKGESMEEYAKRFLPEITTERPVMIGLSFGGMMAVEISRYIPDAAVILISSVPSPACYPWWMMACKYLRVEKMLPEKQFSTYKLFRMIRPVQNYFLGVETEAEIRMANEYRNHVDPVYLNWAVKQVLHWKCNHRPKLLYHIHGGKDHIFPLRNIKPDYIIKTGGHFMVWNRAEEVNKILSEILQDIQRKILAET